jgi:hypothetical protein
MKQTLSCSLTVSTYNEEGATALCNAIQMILRPKGNVIGVLPDYRVGIDLFENIMESNGFVLSNI